MLRFLSWGICLSALIFFAAAEGRAEEKGRESDSLSVEVISYPYFVKNTFLPPEGDSARLIVIDQTDLFNDTFGVGYVMGKEPKRTVDEDYFKTHIAAALVEWGDTPWEYTVRSAVKDQNNLVVKISKGGIPSATAVFTPFLILGISRTCLDGLDHIIFDLIPADAPVAETGKRYSADL